MEKLDSKQIINWILDNKEQQDEIDTVSNFIFPYTTKYKERYKRYRDDNDHSEVDVHI